MSRAFIAAAWFMYGAKYALLFSLLMSIAPDLREAKGLNALSAAVDITAGLYGTIAGGVVVVGLGGGDFLGLSFFVPIILSIEKTFGVDDVDDDDAGDDWGDFLVVGDKVCE
jgi:hypothetical protein